MPVSGGAGKTGSRSSGLYWMARTIEQGRRRYMSHTTSSTSSRSLRPTALGSVARAITLALATLTTGLAAGVLYAYAVSVNLGLAVQPDESYVATMQAINQKIQNPLFFASFFGAILFSLAALAANYPRPRSGRFWLIVLACVLYIGGGFLLTAFVNVPMNNHLAAVDPGAPARVLARARNAYEGPWDFWNGVRTVFSTLAFLVLVCACLLRENRDKR
jgi:uncharacterized membrane protein